MPALLLFVVAALALPPKPLDYVPRLQNGDFARAVNDGTGQTVAQKASGARTPISKPVIWILTIVAAVVLWVVERALGIGPWRRRPYGYYDDRYNDDRYNDDATTSTPSDSSSSSSEFEGGGADLGSSGTSDSW
jgi:uncharacterized membrane protein YgcG